jgi:hypothetical protein
LLQFLPDAITQHINWYVAGVIIVVGLLIYGFRDLLRFSFTRMWALSGVTYADAVRRRVLWITPVAILGIIVVSQLQRAYSAPDAIRQTIQVCLFVTALVVIVTTLILACTNLSRDIESKVVFTVVTKPTTRLELVLGKVVGFARVSAVILLIMGVFIWAYAHLRAWRFESQTSEYAAAAVASAPLDPSRQLLATRTLGFANDLLLVADDQTLRKARGLDPSFTWVLPQTQSFSLPFALDRDTFRQFSTENAGPELIIKLQVAAASLPQEIAPGMPSVALPPLPSLTVQFMSPEGYSLFTGDNVNRGRPIELTDPTGRTPLLIPVEGRAAEVLASAGTFLVTVTGQEPNYLYGAKAGAIELIIRTPGTDQGGMLQPIDTFNGQSVTGPLFLGTEGNFGSQLRGPDSGKLMTGIYRFRDVPEAAKVDGQVPVQFRVGIERSGADDAAEDLTTVKVDVVNLADGRTYPAEVIRPESNRPVYFAVDAAALAGGDFDLRLTNTTVGHVLGLRLNSLAIVIDQRGFAWNLTKSLLLLWMSAILVAAIAVFASTFLSWPIAFVLTLIILFGRWAVEMLGDSLGPGAGTAFANSIFGAGSEYAQARVVSETVDALGKALTTLANLLPDISVFGSTELIERGITIPGNQLFLALQVLLVFGFPLVVLGYVFLRNKEVAP